MISIYDWYIMGVCVFLIFAYVLMIYIDRGDKK